MDYNQISITDCVLVPFLCDHNIKHCSCSHKCCTFGPYIHHSFQSEEVSQPQPHMQCGEVSQPERHIQCLWVGQLEHHIDCVWVGQLEHRIQCLGVGLLLFFILCVLYLLHPYSLHFLVPGSCVLITACCFVSCR
jgi:hypothetical protein